MSCLLQYALGVTSGQLRCVTFFMCKATAVGSNCSQSATGGYHHQQSTVAQSPRLPTHRQAGPRHGTGEMRASRCVAAVLWRRRPVEDDLDVHHALVAIGTLRTLAHRLRRCCRWWSGLLTLTLASFAMRSAPRQLLCHRGMGWAQSLMETLQHSCSAHGLAGAVLPLCPCTSSIQDVLRRPLKEGVVHASTLATTALTPAPRRACESA